MLRWLVALIQADNREQLHASFRWLYEFVGPHRRAIAGLLLLSLTGTGVALLQPWLTKQLIDNGMLAKDYPMLVLVAVTMILVGIGGTALSGINRYLHTRLSGRILFALRGDLYRHLQTLSPEFFASRRTGDLLARLDGDVAEIQRFAVDSLFSAISAVIGLIGAACLMLMLSWQLSLLVLVMLPPEILWLRAMRRKVERQTRTTRERATDISAFLVETLPATKFIQSMGREDYEQQRLGEFSNRYLRQLLSLQVTEFLTHALPSTLTSLTRAAAFLIGGWWVIGDSWQLGSLIAFSTYLGMATGPVNSLLGLYVAVQRMSVSLNRVAELRMAQASLSVVREAGPLPQGNGLELVQVSFAYAERAPLLHQVSVRIDAGEKVALAGPSGAGKSTLIDLLQRHCDPQQGQVLLGGHDLKQLNLADVRRAVAVVSQETVLFRGTLADNLRYAAPQASDAELEQAVQRAQLAELVTALPHGINTLLGERGQRLSGGQKQRLSIARALLQQPAILVLDEATSAVDEATEQQVIAAIDHLFPDTTRILISHRASTLRGADRYLLLQEGTLQEVSGAELNIQAEVEHG